MSGYPGVRTAPPHAAADKPETIARNRRIVELRRQGLTLQAIGERFGLTPEGVRGILLAHNV